MCGMDYGASRVGFYLYFSNIVAWKNCRRVAWVGLLLVLQKALLDGAYYIARKDMLTLALLMLWLVRHTLYFPILALP